MAVSLTEIDQLLADWQRKTHFVSQNLLELQSLPVFQTLSAPDVGLTGQTGQAVRRSVEAVNELFHQFTLLSDLLAKATDLRQRINPHFHSETRLQEIVYLFSQPTITLQSTPQSLAQRSLLGPTELVETLTPEALLAQMIPAFTQAKDIILAVDRAWLTLEPDLIAFQTEITRLRSQAQQLGLPEPAALAQAEARLNDLRDRTLSDPLGSQLNLRGELQPLLTSVQQTLAQLAQQKAQLTDQFTQARQALAQIQTQNQQIQTLIQDCQLKVRDVTAQLQPPLPAAAITALADWLDRLTTSYNNGLIQPLLVGLSNWLAQVQVLLRQQAQAIACNQAPLNQRNELRGRLDAMQAKAKAKGQAEDPQLSIWATQAREILYSRPSPLNEAIALLTAYEKRLNQGPRD